jgi:prepilin signal peptidase PulO-like enzyme (type II secretory pathway)
VERVFKYNVLNKKEIFSYIILSLFFSLFFYFLKIPFLYILMLWVIGYVALIDFKIKEIPLDLNIILIWSGLLYWSFLKNYKLMGYALGVFMFFLLLAVISKGGIGGGDIKFFFPLVLFLDFSIFLISYFFCSLILIIDMLLNSFKNGWDKKRSVPLIPYFYFGYIIALIYLKIGV